MLSGFEAQVEAVNTDPVKGRSVHVHFLGWSTKYDETIALKPEILASRFAPKNSWTNGPHVPVIKKKAAEPEPYYSGFARQNSVGAPEVRGAVGLRNLGNTSVQTRHARHEPRCCPVAHSFAFLCCRLHWSCLLLWKMLHE